jgi:hypothetical protein
MSRGNPPEVEAAGIGPAPSAGRIPPGYRTLDSDDRTRTLPIDLHAFVSANLDALVGGLLVAVAILVVASLLLLRRAGRLSRRLDAITRGSDAQSLEAVLGTHLERVRAVVGDVDRLAARTAILERDLRQSLGRVGIVRYNPFEETGGNQSFALAVLDGKGDGFVVSSLHARAGTRVYAKAVKAGVAESALSDEETAALREALAKTAPGAAH